jgi:hypothetical protein
LRFTLIVCYQAYALILLTCPGPGWAQNEAQLEESVAPESATAPTEKPTSLEKIIGFPLFQPRLTINLRSYDFGAEFDRLPTQHTWAAGGKLGLQTPEWRDTVSVGAALYGSYPLYVQGVADATQLVAPDGDALLVPGETYLNLRRGAFNVRLFRQLLDAPYLNDQDNRMIPNVFEAYALTYSSEQLLAGAGHVTRMKTRNSDEYLPMAQVAGVPGGDSGVSAGAVRLRPQERTSIGAIVVHNWDVFSIVYASVELGIGLAYQTDLLLSGQFTSQRSVGEALLGEFDTDSAGLKATLGHRRAVLTLAGTTTGSDAGIRSPFGAKPSYLSLMLFDFDRARERAWLVGLSYRLDDLELPSWSFVLNHAEGQGARDPNTGAALDRRRETDITLDYRPQSGKLEGLWLRLRYADGRDGRLRLHQWRVILNYVVQFGR